jgi:hypothetical protein
LAFLAQNKAKLCKNLIITLVFEKNANVFAENWQKSPKILAITSTPDPISEKLKNSFLELPTMSDFFDGFCQSCLYIKHPFIKLPHLMLDRYHKLEINKAFFCLNSS